MKILRLKEKLFYETKIMFFLVQNIFTNIYTFRCHKGQKLFNNSMQIFYELNFMNINKLNISNQV